MINQAELIKYMKNEFFSTKNGKSGGASREHFLVYAMLRGKSLEKTDRNYKDVPEETLKNTLERVKFYYTYDYFSAWIEDFKAKEEDKYKKELEAYTSSLFTQLEVATKEIRNESRK